MNYNTRLDTSCEQSRRHKVMEFNEFVHMRCNCTLPVSNINYVAKYTNFTRSLQLFLGHEIW